jgi:16S rRNA (cytosine1402-N4)-methyltransferase
MMMGLNEFSANDAINKLNKEDIEKILKFFGDEKDAKIISKNIIKFRKINTLIQKIS